MGSKAREHPEARARARLALGPGPSRCRKDNFDAADALLESDFVGRRRSEEGARYRIVYRLLLSEHEPAIVQVFAIGPKYGDRGGVYATAAERYRLLLDEPEERERPAQ